MDSTAAKPPAGPTQDESLIPEAFLVQEPTVGEEEAVYDSEASCSALEAQEETLWDPDPVSQGIADLPDQPEERTESPKMVRRRPTAAFAILYEQSLLAFIPAGVLAFASLVLIQLAGLVPFGEAMMSLLLGLSIGAVIALMGRPYFRRALQAPDAPADWLPEREDLGDWRTLHHSALAGLLVIAPFMAWIVGGFGAQMGLFPIGCLAAGGLLLREAKERAGFEWRDLFKGWSGRLYGMTVAVTAAQLFLIYALAAFFVGPVPALILGALPAYGLLARTAGVIGCRLQHERREG